jgi:predicted Fe-Mo cluster-binding NifX family protein
MKIAVPTRDSKVDDHFGHCEYYTLVELNNNKEIVNVETFDSPQGCGCKSDVATVLKEKGIELMLAGNMGQGAVNKIAAAEIKVIRGCSGDVLTVVSNYVKGNLKDSGETCTQHEAHSAQGYSLDLGHSCSHN